MSPNVEIWRLTCVIRRLEAYGAAIDKTMAELRKLKAACDAALKEHKP